MVGRDDSRKGGGEHPSEPGWYPDPWSATGTGERYFDGERWGTSDRPLARHTSTVVEEGSSRARRRRSAASTRSRPETDRTSPISSGSSRVRKVVLPVALLVLLVGATWVLQHSHHSSSSTSASTATTAPDHPPPSHEAATPLGQPGAVPAGNGGFQFLQHQPGNPSAPVAFDPCRPIHYVVNPAGAPRDGASLVSRAIADVHKATGLDFVDDGATSEAPATDRLAYQPSRYGKSHWAPVLIAWSNEKAYQELAGYVAGVGAPEAAYARSDRLEYVTGQVVLDSRDLSTATMPDRVQAKAVILHELGHLVGLDHTSDRRQLMFSEAEFNVHDYGDGDLRGLSVLGSQRCYPGT